jgi:hypothetical protein
MLQCPELSIEEMLTDPIVRALMTADDVIPEELQALVHSVAEYLRASSHQLGEQ